MNGRGSQNTVFLGVLVIALCLATLGITTAGVFAAPATEPLAQSTPVAASTLLMAGDARQVIQFNTAAALQKRIFADGFVPNSAEFRMSHAELSYAAQRAERLDTGSVRIYYVPVGDWGNVQYVERGNSGTNPLSDALISEGEKRQLIQFNTSAALQKKIFADGFVPNSAEFLTPISGANYASQRAEHLGNGQVRVYYTRVGDWGNVTYVQRGSGGVVVVPSPTPGSAGPTQANFILYFYFGTTGCPNSTLMGPNIERFYVRDGMASLDPTEFDIEKSLLGLPLVQDYQRQWDVVAVPVAGWGNDGPGYRARGQMPTTPIGSNPNLSVDTRQIPVMVAYNKQTRAYQVIAKGYVPYATLVTKTNEFKAGKQPTLVTGST
jgi:hypothetical protein